MKQKKQHLHFSQCRNVMLTLLLLLGAAQYTAAQCTNTNRIYNNGGYYFPIGNICGGTLISTQFKTNDYAVVILGSPGTYSFQSNCSSDYITLKDTLGNVIASGVTPLYYTKTTANNVSLYAQLQVNTNANCGRDLAGRAITGFYAAGNMTYLGATTSSVSSVATQGALDSWVFKLTINASTCIGNPLTVSDIYFNLANTTNPTDIVAAKVYCVAPLAYSFSTRRQFGTAVLSPNGAVTISGSQPLVYGANEFYLVFDMSCYAQIGNIVNARCDSFKMSGTTYIPAVTAPGSGKTIVANTYTQPNYTNYSSATSTQQGTRTLNMGTVMVQGLSCANNVSSVTFNTGTTPAGNISNAKCFYNSSTDFANAVPYGSPVLSPNGNFTFNGSQDLQSGAGNYFYLTYDIDCNANPGDSIAASPVNITVNGSTNTINIQGANPKKAILPRASYTAHSATSTSGAALNLPIGRTKLNGMGCASSVTSVKFNTGTSNPSDILNARCYYTTTDAFSAAVPFGSPVAAPNGDITFTGSQNTNDTANYFWLAYDLSCNTTTGDSVTAVPVSITTNVETTPVAVPSVNPKKGITSSVFTTIADGEWSNPAIWACGAPPNSMQQAVIANNVTLSTTGNVASDVTILSGKSLTITAGDLTLGPNGGGNKQFLNQGTLSVSGGNLNINGKLRSPISSAFYQSGGTIRVDGNAAGVAANSSTGTMVELVPFIMHLTGGTIIVPDPAVGNDNTFSCSSPNLVISDTLHTVQIGDNVSTTPTANVSGFQLSGVVGNLIVNGPSTGNRAVGGNLNIRGNLSVINNGWCGLSLILLKGNLTVEAGATLANTQIEFNSDRPQLISGDGTFKTPSSPANFSILKVLNYSNEGVTFANANTLLSGSNTGTIATLFNVNGVINLGTKTIIVGTSANQVGAYTFDYGYIQGKIKKWLAANTDYAVQFGLGNVNGKKTISLPAGTSIISAGSITAEWIDGDPGSNGLPIVEGTNNYAYVVGNGYWRLTRADGLVTGPSTVSINITGPSNITSFNNLSFATRASAADNWTLPGTYQAPASGFIATRNGLTSLGEFTLVSPAAPLPVQLKSFTGKNAGEVNQLNWETAEEKNFSHFELQRSADGISFSSITEVSADRNSNGSSYAYTDASPFKGINIYRLKMVDLDGKASLSQVVTLDVKGTKHIGVQVYPNPVKQTLSVSISGQPDGRATLQLLDLTGKVVRNISLQGNNAQVDMSQMPSGMYLMKYTDNSHSSVIKITRE